PLPGLIALGILVLGLAGGVYAKDLVANERPNSAAREMVTLGQEIQTDTELLKAAAAGGASKRQASGRNMLDIAERPATALLSLMEKAPDLALENAFPEELRGQLPSDVRAHIEEPVMVTGTLEVLGWVAEDGRVGYERYIDTEDARLRIFTTDWPDNY